MPPHLLKRTAITMVLLVVGFLVCWEIYLRQSGTDHAFDDGESLWSYHRGKVYDPKESSTVFIGSSRIKFDLDMSEWETLTGDHPVQLSCVGSSPLPVLYDLADDEDFKGKLIVDVTEVLFYSPTHGASRNPKKYVEYYHDITPAQRASFMLTKPLESGFVFLDKDHYSLNAMLDKMEIRSRPGVFMFPIFPRDFDRVKFNRQSYMTPEFVADTHQHNQVRAIWAFLGSQREKPPVSGTAVDSLHHVVKAAVDKIRSRGGDVLFVRTPSSGPFWAVEQKNLPREKYWDQLLQVTGAPGIHFKDDPNTDHYICPEFSHLTPDDAKDYTRHLIKTLTEKYGWKFAALKTI
jgi:hypothetical protein